jgi:enediyne biosynthesis protein E4
MSPALARITRSAAAVLFSLSLSGCGSSKAQPGLPPEFRFVDVAAPAGIVFHHSNGDARPLDILDTTGSGLAWLDYDQDGHPDLYCVRGKPGHGQGDALFRNRGDGTFEDVSRQAGIQAGGYGMGCAVADYDGNGYPDLYVTRYGPNALYRNRGDGTFEEVTARAGVAGKPLHSAPKWSLGAAWFDADDDRDLDLYVTNYVAYGPGSQRLCTFKAVMATCPPHHYPAQPHLFYRNRGNGTFEEASGAVGFAVSDPGRGMAALPFRPNPGGKLALYVANDTTPNFLFVRAGNGKYRETAFENGCAVSETGEDTASMGVDSGDVDGDGRPDILVTTFQHESKSLYRNLGGHDFADVSSQVGLGAPTWNFLAFGCGLVDLDLDGDLDAVWTNGHLQDNVPEVDPSASYRQTPQLFQNSGGRFTDVSSAAGPAFQQPLVGRGMAFADYDADGDVDIAVSTNGGPVQLWRNDSPRRHHWFQLRLTGKAPNVEAQGAQVTLEVAGRKQIAEVHSGRSYLADSERRLTFGLGTAGRIDRLTVRWPDGSLEVRQALAADQCLTLSRAKPLRTAAPAADP